MNPISSSFKNLLNPVPEEGPKKIPPSDFRNLLNPVPEERPKKIPPSDFRNLLNPPPEEKSGPHSTSGKAPIYAAGPSQRHSAVAQFPNIAKAYANSLENTQSSFRDELKMGSLSEDDQKTFDRLMLDVKNSLASWEKTSTMSEDFNWLIPPFNFAKERNPTLTPNSFIGALRNHFPNSPSVATLHPILSQKKPDPEAEHENIAGLLQECRELFSTRLTGINNPLTPDKITKLKNLLEALDTVTNEKRTFNQYSSWLKRNGVPYAPSGHTLERHNIFSQEANPTRSAGRKQVAAQQNQQAGPSQPPPPR